MREQRLEDVRYGELCTCCRPTTMRCGVVPVVAVTMMGDVRRLVDDTHLVVDRFEFESIAIFRSHVIDERNDVFVDIGYFDRIGLDMHHRIAKFQNLLFEQKHEQGSAFRHLVIDITIVGAIPDVVEFRRELRTGQTVDRIDHDLQRLRKRLGVFALLEQGCQSAIHTSTSGFEIAVLDIDTGGLDIAESFRVRTEEIHVLKT